MALFLVQHGISAAKDIDPERGLTTQGKAETERIAQVAKGYGIGVKKIMHSGKNRAEQTAAIYHDALHMQTPLEIVADINPHDDVRILARTIRPESDVMVVGHMPFLQRLVSFLITGEEDRKVYQFQNSGIVCLDAEKEKDGKVSWFIKWTLNPHIA